MGRITLLIVPSFPSRWPQVWRSRRLLKKLNRLYLNRFTRLRSLRQKRSRVKLWVIFPVAEAKILGMESDGALQRLQALVPLAELYGYQSALNRITQGRAHFVREFHGYEEVPSEIVQKLVKEFKPVEVA